MGSERVKTGVIVDSNMTLEQALFQLRESNVALEVLADQRLVEVEYFSFDARLHRGQMVVNKDLVWDIADLFKLIKDLKFPIQSVIPIVAFDNDDEASVSANNSSGFNYRNIALTNELSNHAHGRAIDLNPYINPYIRDDYRFPPGVDYDPNVPGAMVAEGPIVQFLKSRGWGWGGDWVGKKDWQHFDKPL